ncbi:MAG TPA: glycosyltransferase family 25 protein [Trebonia sp.]|nr:glycosyltransferase family 25 protein [Trebonia sp.]
MTDLGYADSLAGGPVAVSAVAMNANILRSGRIVQLYVINLTRSAGRRAFMRKQLDKLRIDHEFIVAVDGRELDLSDTETFDPAWIADPGFRPGAAGCALSHLAVYKKILETGAAAALVLEDDVELPQDLLALAEAVDRYLHMAEVVLLNFHSDQPCRITRANAQELPESRLLVDVVDVSQVSSTGCYVISREACERIVADRIPLGAFADEWWRFQKFGWLDRVRCVVPIAVPNAPSLRTTIDVYQHDSLKARLREFVSESKMPVVHQLLALRRKRTFRRLGWVGKIEFVD